MKQEFRLVAKSRFFLWTLFASLFFRILVICYFLPSSSSSWAVDEGTYARLSNYLAVGNSPEEFPIYGSKLYYNSRSFIQPCVLLVKLGFDALVSVRLVATFFAVAGIFMLAIIYVGFIVQKNPNLQSIDEALDRKSKLLFLTYAFFPSYLLWTVLGLKESTSQFWIIATFFALVKLYTKPTKNRFLFFFLFIASLTFAFGARPQTAYVFSLTALGLSLFSLIKHRQLLLLPIVSIGLLSGILFSNPAPYQATADPTPSHSNGSADPTPSHSNGSADPRPEVSSSSKPKNVSLPQQEIQIAISRLEVLLRSINEKSRENAQGAASEFSPDNCSLYIRAFLDITCTLSKVPTRTFSFLFKPIPFVDQGSLSLIWASYENIIWILLFMLLFVAIFQSRLNVLRINPLMAFILSYSFIFVVSAALYEGNVGTAFRHKTTILWPLILSLLMANLKKVKT